MQKRSASILIVDDEELNLDILARRLEKEGYSISSTLTAREAIDTMKVEKFDLVLLDIMLPDISGIEVLERIKRDPGLKDTPVMMVSAHGDREMVLNCISKGAADYLVKPYSMPVVKSRIWRCLHNSCGVNVVSAENPAVNGRILLVDDQELNRDVLARRLEKTGYQVSCAANGEQALQMLAEDDYDLLLLDIMMPDISGVEVLNRLRAQEDYQHIPVIMISALDDMETVNKCMEQGADDYIVKPLNTILLNMRIESCLRSSVINAA